MDKKEFLQKLLDAIMKAIEPSLIKREWIEFIITPIVDQLFEGGLK